MKAQSQSSTCTPSKILFAHVTTRPPVSLIFSTSPEAHRATYRAISPDPYAEQIYRTLMELYAKLGRIAEIERAYRELEAALSEGLDAEPTDETNTLKTSLLRQLTHSSDV